MFQWSIATGIRTRAVRRIRNDSCGQAVAEAGGLVSQVLGLGTQAEFVVQGSGAECAGLSWSGFLGFFCWGIWIRKLLCSRDQEKTCGLPGTRDPTASINPRPYQLRIPKSHVLVSQGEAKRREFLRSQAVIAIFSQQSGAPRCKI